MVDHDGAVGDGALSTTWGKSNPERRFLYSALDEG
jgi:hypothetical protein